MTYHLLALLVLLLLYFLITQGLNAWRKATALKQAEAKLLATERERDRETELRRNAALAQTEGR